MTTTPDFERAATAAAETLVKFGINSAPVSTLPILKHIPNVLVFSYEELSVSLEQNRACILSAVGERNQDAFTTVSMIDGQPHYIVTYNQRLPTFLCQRALARELGHIVLGHDGSRPESVRLYAARAFAYHLQAPRALIHALDATGIRITKEVLGNLTGCYDYCLSCMRRIPPVHVSAALTRQIRQNYMPFILNYFEYQRFASKKDGSESVDFGTYMEGYEE
jgi:hypothetical protein